MAEMAKDIKPGEENTKGNERDVGGFPVWGSDETKQN